MLRWQSPEMYNLVFQYHTQPLFDFFKAILLVHFHCAQPVWPMKHTSKMFNPVELRSILTPLQPLSSTQTMQGKTQKLPRNWLQLVFEVPFVSGKQRNDNVSPFGLLKEWVFGILSLSKLEFACSFRGSARFRALGALWGPRALITHKWPPVTAALSDFKGRVGGWIIRTMWDYGNKG